MTDRHTAQPANVSIDAPTNASRQLEIIIPITTAELTGYLPRHVNVRLDERQARTLNRVFNALHAGSYRTSNGKHVDKLGHVVPWLIDQLTANGDEL